METAVVHRAWGAWPLAATGLVLAGMAIGFPGPVAWPAAAGVVVWKNPADGFWDVADNWDPGIPGPGDIVDLTGNAAGYAIKIRNNVGQVQEVKSKAIVRMGNNSRLSVVDKFDNQALTEIIQGTLVLDGASTLKGFFMNQAVLEGTGNATVKGVTTYVNAFHHGPGTTRHEGDGHPPDRPAGGGRRSHACLRRPGIRRAGVGLWHQRPSRGE